MSTWSLSQLLAGLHDDTYGLPTALPWGIDLGDGVPRHPAPLNDIPRLDRRHVALAVFGLVVFALLLMPTTVAPVTATSIGRLPKICRSSRATS